MFQPMDAAEQDRRRQRNRVHLDLLVPHDQARLRIDAALAAGGRILTDSAPDRQTLADPEGNEVTIHVLHDIDPATAEPTTPGSSPHSSTPGTRPPTSPLDQVFTRPDGQVLSCAWCSFT